MINTSGFALPKPNHQEGQVRLTKAERKRETQRRWEAGERTCHICEHPILDRENYCLDHVEPGKFGGCRNDVSSNLRPAHIWPCNSKKGSQRSK